MFFISADLGSSFVTGLEKARQANWDDLLNGQQVDDNQMTIASNLMDLERKQATHSGLLAYDQAANTQMLNNGPTLADLEMKVALETQRDSLGGFAENRGIRSLNALNRRLTRDRADLAARVKDLEYLSQAFTFGRNAGIPDANIMSDPYIGDLLNKLGISIYPELFSQSSGASGSGIQAYTGGTILPPDDGSLASAVAKYLGPGQEDLASSLTGYGAPIVRSDSSMTPTITPRQTANRFLPGPYTQGALPPSYSGRPTKILEPLGADKLRSIFGPDPLVASSMVQDLFPLDAYYQYIASETPEDRFKALAKHLPREDVEAYKHYIQPITDVELTEFEVKDIKVPESLDIGMKGVSNPTIYEEDYTKNRVLGNQKEEIINTLNNSNFINKLFIDPSDHNTKIKEAIVPAIEQSLHLIRPIGNKNIHILSNALNPGQINNPVVRSRLLNTFLDSIIFQERSYRYKESEEHNRQVEKFLRELIKAPTLTSGELGRKVREYGFDLSEEELEHLFTVVYIERQKEASASFGYGSILKDPLVAYDPSLFAPSSGHWESGITKSRRPVYDLGLGYLFREYNSRYQNPERFKTPYSEAAQ